MPMHSGGRVLTNGREPVRQPKIRLRLTRHGGAGNDRVRQLRLSLDGDVPVRWRTCSLDGDRCASRGNQPRLQARRWPCCTKRRSRPSGQPSPQPTSRAKPRGVRRVWPTRCKVSATGARAAAGFPLGDHQQSASPAQARRYPTAWQPSSACTPRGQPILGGPLKPWRHLRRHCVSQFRAAPTPRCCAIRLFAAATSQRPFPPTS
mmetsp:Transcript_90504/g.255492  ORF Transcript_90504/g.255492 Transcript_90504/m.255492 type:complete len:205 (-) Transcript_90504:452-1066(-)